MFDYWSAFGCHRKICESAPRIPWVEGWTSNFQLIILMFTRVPRRWSIAIWGNQATVLTGCVFSFFPASLRSFAGKKSDFCLGPRGNGTRIRKFASKAALPVMMDDPLSQELAQPSGGYHWGKSNQTNWRVDSESRLPIILAMNMLNTSDVLFICNNMVEDLEVRSKDMNKRRRVHFDV